MAQPFQNFYSYFLHHIGFYHGYPLFFIAQNE